MTLVMQLAQLCRKVPLSAWLTVALALLLMGGCWERGAYGAREYERGRQAVIKGAAFDSTLRSVVVAGHAKAVAHTDTVIRRVVVTSRRVDTLVLRVPDSVRVRFPVVDSLVLAATSLTARVDTLTRALDAERAAATLRFAVDSAALVYERVKVVGLQDEVKRLEKRPRWRTVVTTGVLAVASTLVLRR